MNEPTNRAKMIGAARRSLLNSGIEYWCERDDLPLNAAIDAIDAAKAVADDETRNEAINEAFWKSPKTFWDNFDSALNLGRLCPHLADEIDGYFEWVLIEALDELPSGIKRETVAQDHAKRYRDVVCEAQEAGL